MSIVIVTETHFTTVTPLASSQTHEVPVLSRLTSAHSSETSLSATLTSISTVSSTLSSSILSISSQVSPSPIPVQGDELPKRMQSKLIPILILLSIISMVMLFILAIMFVAIQRLRNRCPECAEAGKKNKQLEQRLHDLGEAVDPISKAVVRDREAVLASSAEMTDEKASQGCEEDLDGQPQKPLAGYIHHEGSVKSPGRRSTMSIQGHTRTVSMNRKDALARLTGQVHCTDVEKQDRQYHIDRDESGYHTAEADGQSNLRQPDNMKRPQPGRNPYSFEPYDDTQALLGHPTLVPPPASHPSRGKSSIYSNPFEEANDHGWDTCSQYYNESHARYGAGAPTKPKPEHGIYSNNREGWSAADRARQEEIRNKRRTGGYGAFTPLPPPP